MDGFEPSGGWCATRICRSSLPPDGSLGVRYRVGRAGDWELRSTRLECAIP